MKKLKKIVIYIVLLTAIIFMMTRYVYASKDSFNINDFISLSEYSDDFKEWVKLSDEEKNNTLSPKLYNMLDDSYISENPIYQAAIVGASVNSRFSLQEKIPANLEIRNQRSTSLCWAFAGLSSLETNLALSDYRNGLANAKIYDYSERHANYSSTRTFLNGQVNDYGVDRNLGEGGQWYLIETYLTNGKGAIPEENMPFEDNEDVIDISQLDNKNPVTTLYDTVYFDNYNQLSGDARTQTMNEIKQHIQNYGSVFATIHGNSANSVLDSCYDNDTGAKYCSNQILHRTDHAVSTIGWDDDYDKNNFQENSRPNENGAWIVRNSWGENLEYDLSELKEELYRTYPTQCNSHNWFKPEDIPDEFIESAGYKISGDKVLLPIGDHGLMYVSYEDCNVGATLYGVVSSSDSVDYDYVYQYNKLYPAIQIAVNTNETVLCNVFDKQSDSTEYLTEVSLTAPEAYECKVYVNPNGEGKSSDELKPVKLVTGDSEKIDKGYHTLEFAEPVEITGDKYTVAIEIIGTRPNTIDILLEGKVDSLPLFDNVQVERNKCFVSTTTDFDNCEWVDLGDLETVTTNLPNGDSSIKAFTKTALEDKSVSDIEIISEPNKTEYIEGENFDKTGMKVIVYFNDGTSKELSDSDYNISNGSNLKSDQTYVTITYMGKTAEQQITVKENENLDTDPVDTDKEPDEKEEVPVNTNVTNCYTTISKVQSYQYTDDASKNYTLVELEVAGIKRDLSNDSFEYSYYLSSNPNLKNITDWVKIKEEQKLENKLQFKIDSRDIPNFSEISKSNTIYLYVRESVEKGGNQSVITTSAMNFNVGDAKIETYVDNTKKDNSGTTNNNQNNGNNGNSGVQGDTSKNQGGQTVNQDDTTSKSNLPKTGATILAVFIIIIAIVGIVTFVRYEILNKNTKL